MRFILKLSYNGTAYHGWQKQENANSVQSMIENALKKGIEPKKIKNAISKANDDFSAEEIAINDVV